MNVLQIIAIVFALFAISRVILRMRDKKLTPGEFFFWTLIWLGLLGVVFFPSLTSRLANLIGIGRGIDLIIYGSIAILFYLLFRIYVKIEEIEQEITKVVREISIIKKKK
ncbi:DUF2304 family protein [Candidatus Woesearchaeota archaeon]|nr:DUF2304 family protein [Candidatus Woesearchaeota archaeon]